MREYEGKHRCIATGSRQLEKGVGIELSCDRRHRGDERACQCRRWQLFIRGQPPRSGDGPCPPSARRLPAS